MLTLKGFGKFFGETFVSHGGKEKITVFYLSAIKMEAGHKLSIELM